MPQMAPINWLSLFIMFVMSLIIFSALNYFFVLYAPKKFSSKSKASINGWQW